MRIFSVAFIFFLFPYAPVVAQDLKVALKQDKMPYAPRNFFVSSVTDDRANKKNIGIITADNKGGKIVFNDDAAAELQQYIDADVDANRQAQPVTLHIAKLDAQLKKQGALWQVNESLVLSFYVAGQKAIEYTTGTKGTVDKAPAEFLEKTIRQSIESDFRKFDAWWQRNKRHIPNDTSVHVMVTVNKTTDKPGYIAYSLQRPLQIADFQGPVQGQAQELAETESGFFLTYNSEVKNGRFTLDIVITPYFDKNISWFRESGKEPRVLAHEQAHFDITAIKTCELANELRKAHFTQDNYEEVIKSLQQKNLQLSMDEEEQYDRETNHGTIPDKQLMWQNRVSEQVKATGCY